MLIWCPDHLCECAKTIIPQPKAGFFMFSTREDTDKIRSAITATFESKGLHLINAMARTGSEDNYCKICEQILSTAFGVALITKDTPHESLHNIYLEIGLVRAFGKEALILTPDIKSVTTDLAGKGVLPYKSEEEMKQKIISWTEQIPKKVHDYNTHAEIALTELNDYEKFFDYSKKAIMFGDFSTPIKELNAVFNSKKPMNHNISKRLQSEAKVFLKCVKRESDRGKRTL
jgi:hypothetical protein